MDYYSVTNVQNNVGYPAGTKTVGSCVINYTQAGGAGAGNPAPVLRRYEPFSESVTLYDPTKGRSFNALKRTGAILFSPYTNSRITTRNYISSREYDQSFYVRLGLSCMSSPPVCYVGDSQLVKRIWTENDDFSSLSSRLTIRGKLRNTYDGDVSDAISSTQQSAFDQALNAYDLLTELGELRETVAYLGSKLKGGADLVSRFAEKDLPTWKQGHRKTPKDLMRSSDKLLRSLGRRWMEYRYAIMPLLYSFKDVEEVLSGLSDQYKSDRSKVKIDLADSPAIHEDECLVVSSSGSIEVRSLTKGRFSLGDLQRLVTSLGMNPLRTAWELTPLSYVVDWLLNVGEAITALTGIDYASERLGTTSVRERSTFTYVHHDRNKWSNFPPSRVNACGQDYTPAAYSYDKKYENVVREVVTDSYIRSLWSRPTAKIIFDPYLNWKRLIDAFVLGYQPTKKILRSLK